MADQSTPASSVDIYALLSLRKNPDGTITRLASPVPEVPATGDGVDADVFTKDVPLNTANNISVRIYRPKNATKGSNLPLIIYFHGGGFILCSVASLPFNEVCIRMARELSAIIVSVDYRLAPEHRLPAAYDDGVEAVQWVKNQALDQSNGEPWLRDYIDFSKCFMMGGSAGANIVYYVAFRLWSLGLDQLQPVKISGLILHQPFVGGVQRKASELRKVDDPLVPYPSTDLMWELCLPIDTDRNHDYCNPMVKGLSESEIEALNSQSCLVCIGGEDPLLDHQKEFTKMLKGSGVKFVEFYDEKACHAVEFREPQKCEGLFKAYREFIY
ncbi:probable carboxylesterase 8 [Telopea speciosissima]|uniref:probable carboxylesterase 8 n=1 Tax=Telopea speciosissima TaxID=54955 RepID=UPI001CC3BE9D|nr:probable carboxylesterase 8 [Telopea speciosissima]